MSRPHTLNDPTTGQFHGRVNIHIATPHAVLVRTRPTAEAPEEKGFHYHCLPFYWALVSGSATETLSSGQKRLYRPMVPIYTPAGEVHAHGSHGEPPVGLGVIILPETIKSIGAVSNFGPMEVLKHEAVMTVNRLNAECDQRDQASLLAIDGLVLELLAHTLRSRPERPDAVAPRWLLNAKDLLHDRLADNLRIGEVAAEVGIHPVHLSREFRRHFGMTAGEYLRQTRLRAAARMLERSDQAIAAIAGSLGFHDEAHLSHSFKKLFGISPSAYRRTVRS